MKTVARAVAVGNNSPRSANGRRRLRESLSRVQSERAADAARNGPNDRAALIEAAQVPLETRAAASTLSLRLGAREGNSNAGPMPVAALTRRSAP